jgi:hypothetical protein
MHSRMMNPFKKIANIVFLAKGKYYFFLEIKKVHLPDSYTIMLPIIPKEKNTS